MGLENMYERILREAWEERVKRVIRRVQRVQQKHKVTATKNGTIYEMIDDHHSRQP